VNTTPLEQVAGNYSADAEAYETGWAPALLPYTLVLLDRLPLAKSTRVLDAGAGVGTLLPEIARRAPAATVVGIDCAAGMLARAPARFPRALMDVLHQGFLPASFDVVVMAFMLFHTEDPLEGLREARRVLRPGGRAAAITWDGDLRCPAQAVLFEELDAAGAAACASSHAAHEPLSTPGKTHALFGASGFESIEAWTAPFEHPYDPATFLETRTSRGLARRRLETLPPERRASFLERTGDRLSRLSAGDFIERAGLVYTVGMVPGR
jgi:SAM-dependent methyltransferase